MKTGFVDSIPSVDGGKIKIIHRSVGQLPAVDKTKPPMGVDHTTEGYTIPPGFDRGVPHFSVGPLKTGGPIHIVQLIGLGQISTALKNPVGGVETNFWALMQIEIVAFTKLTPWMPGPEQSIKLASLYQFAHDELGIPKKSVFPNNLAKTPLHPGQIWASTNNPRRDSGKWGHEPGWYAHIEVPENDHYDCGSYARDKVLKLAENFHKRH